MTPANHITHLVHIGFDEKEAPEFETRILAHIQQICDNAAHIVNFVDEAPYTIEDGDVLQTTHLAECLTKFVSLCDLKSTGVAKFLDFDKGFDEIPAEVLAFLREELEGEWQKMQTPIAEYEQWLIGSRKIGGYPAVLPDHIQASIDTHEQTKKSILGERFSSILEKMVAKFKGKNIFGLDLRAVIRNDTVRNPERKLRLVESTEGLIGKQRILFSGMRDGDMNRIHGAIHGEKQDEDFRNLLAKSQVEYHDWEQWFGGATDEITRINRALSLERANRYYRAFLQSLKDIGFTLDETTQHILGGEYYGRCVHSYGNNLLLYGIPKQQIHVDANISLVHSQDNGNFQL